MSGRSVAAAVLASLAAAPGPAPHLAGASPQDVRISVVGRSQVVFDWSHQRCASGTSDVPDLEAHAFRDARGSVQLIAGNDPSRRFIGTDLNHLRHHCGVILGSRHKADPAAFNDHQWFAAPYTLDGSRIYALVHDEYHGYEHSGECPTTRYARYTVCWYDAITLAVSTNRGASYAAVRGRRLVFTTPYRYVPGAGPEGIFTVSNIVHNDADGYYYALAYVNERDSYVGSCLMRTRKLGDAGSWRAWSGGSSFGMSFVNPYGAVRSRARHLCRPIAHWQPGDLQPESLTYNTAAHQWLLIGMASQGVYYALSPDLISWTQPRLFYRRQVSWTFHCGGHDPLEYPSLIDPASQSRNFETSGKTAYLYFTLLRYSCPNPTTSDRDLLRVPVRITPAG